MNQRQSAATSSSAWASQALKMGLFKAISLSSQTLSSVLVARTLGPSEFGVMAFAITLTSLAALPALSGLNQLIVREVARQDTSVTQTHSSRVISNCRTWIALFSVISLVVFVSWTFLYASEASRTQVYLIAALTIPVMSFNVLYSSILQGMGKATRSQLAEWLLAPGAYLVFVTALSLEGILTATTAISSYLLALILAFVFLINQARQNEAVIQSLRFQMPDVNWFRLWLPFALLHAVGVINSAIPILALGVFSDDTSTAMFRVGESLAAIVSIPLLVVNLAAAPRFVGLHLANDREALQKLAQSLARRAFIFSLLMSLFFWIFGKSLIELVYGHAYQQSYAVSSWLIFGQMVNVACGSVGLILNMTGHEKENLRAFFFSSLLNIILCLMLVGQWQEIGAAIAAVGSLITWNLWLLWRVNHQLNIRASIF